jgi:hypothetical protein
MVVADVLSSTEAQCVSSAGNLGTVSLFFASSQNKDSNADQLAMDGVGLTFRYHFTMSLIRASPLVANSIGGSIISLVAINIEDGASVVCAIDDNVQTKARTVRAGIVECMMPATQVGNHTMEISLNSQDWSVTDGLRIKTIGTMNVTSVSPAVVLAGSEVSVVGAGFSAAPGLYCGVGGSSLQGTSWSHSVASVVSGSSLSCVLPSRGNGMQVVEVTSSINGRMTDSGMQVEYVSAGRASSMWPSSGVVSGQSVVTLVGEGFVAGRTGCRFESSGAMVDANVLSSTEAVCMSSPGAVGTTSVSVSSNGVDSTSLFLFERLPEPETLLPAAADFDSLGPFKDAQWCRFNGVILVSAKHSDTRSSYCAFKEQTLHLLEVSANKQDFTRIEMQSLFRQDRNNITAVLQRYISPTAGSQLSVSWLSAPSISAVLLDNVALMHSSTTLRWFDSEFTTPRYISEGFKAVHGPSVNNVQQVEVKASIRLTHVTPSASPDTGGSIVTLTGQWGDRLAEEMQVSFGTTAATCEAISTTELRCETPATAAGMTEVVVQDSSSSIDHVVTANFVVVQRTHAEAMTPSQGTEDGGTVISFNSEVSLPQDLSCKFVSSGITVYAVRSASTEARCLTPRHMTGNTTIVVLPSSYDTDVELSARSFHFKTRLNLTDVAPRAGPSTGGTVTLLAGTGLAAFAGHHTAICAFSTVQVASDFLNPGRISCRAPSHAAGFTELRLAFDSFDEASTTTTGFAFDFQEPATVDSVYPLSGPREVANTMVTLFGSNFVNSQDLGLDTQAALVCRFGDKSVPALYLSSTEIICNVPSMTAASFGSVSVSVSNNYVESKPFNTKEYTEDSVTYTLSNQIDIYEVSPQHGSVQGGSMLELKGQLGAKPSEELWCRFGANPIYVKALSVNRTSVICVTPATNQVYDTPVSLELSYNLQHYYDVNHEVRYASNMNVTSVTPRLVSVLGDAPIRMHVSPFPTHAGSCRFGKYGSTVFTPILADPDPIDGVSAPPMHGLCLTVPHPAGFAVVELQAQQDAFTEQLEFQELPHVVALEPAVGPLDGGTRVTVIGSGFSDMTNGCYCKFGTQFVKAELRSSVEVVCETPRMAHVTAEIVTVTNLQSDTSYMPDGALYHTAASSMHFHWTEPGYVHDIEQSKAPEVGGTTVTLLGEFPIPYSFLCRIGTVIVQADINYNNTRLVCPVAAGSARSKNDMWFGFNMYDEMPVGHELIYVPATNITSPDQLSMSVDSVRGAVFRLSSDFSTIHPSSLQCMYDNIVSAGLTTSHSTAECLSPAMSAGFRAVEVSFIEGGQTSTFGSDVQVVTTRASQIDSFWPSSGMASGGTVVTVSGSGFAPGRTTCRFGASGIAMETMVVSSTEVRCISTAQLPGRSDVELQVLDNSVHTKAGISRSFFFDTSYGVREVAPDVAQAGSVVTLVGRDMIDGANYRCVFGSVIVDANKPCTNGRIECTVPALPSANVTLQISANSEDHSNGVEVHVLPNFVNLTSTRSADVVIASTGARVLFQGTDLHMHRRDVRCTLQLTGLSCMSPPKAEGFAMVNDFTLPETTLAAVQLEHVATPLIESVYPSAANRAGGSTVTVSGSGFMTSQYDASVCVFQSSSSVFESVAANVLSDSELTCITPTVHRGHYEPVALSVSTAPGSPSHVNFDMSYDIHATEFETTATDLGTTVRVVVQGVYWASTDTTDVWCRLGSVYVQASVDTVNSAVTCAAPDGVTGPTAIEISLYGQQFNSLHSLVNLQFPEAPLQNITAVPCGSSDHCMLPIGSVTPLTVSMVAQPETLSCRLDYTSSMAQALANGKWECLLDIVPSTGEGFSQVEWTSSEVSHKDAEAMPTHVLAAAVEIIKAAEIITVTPTTADLTGGTIVTIVGKNLNDGMTCDFGGVRAIPISTQSSAEATCVVPASIRGATELQITGTLASSFNFLFEESLAVQAPKEATVAAGGSLQIISPAPFSHCLFDTVLVEASVTQFENKQHCVVPVLRPGPASLSVCRSDAQQFASAGLVTMLPTANVSAISSQRLTAGNTHDVILIGQSLTTAAPIGCATSTTVSWEVIPSKMATSSVSYTCRLLPGLSSGFAAVDLSLSTMTEYTHSHVQIELTESATLSMIYPSQGAAVGGTVITVAGTNLKSGYKCNFASSTLVDAIVLSSTEMICQSPSGIFGATTVAIRMNGQDLQEFSFRYTAPVTVELQPQQTFVTGGTMVAFAVNPPLESQTILCRFGDVVMEAAPIEHGLGCLQPAVISGKYSLGFSVNQYDWSASANVVTVLSVVNTTAIDIDSATTFSMTTRLATLSTVQTLESLQMRILCVVGTMHTRDIGTLLSATSAQCRVESREEGFKTLEVTPLNEHMLPGAQGVAQIQFRTQAAVESVFPSVSASAGGTVITLSGSGFMPGHTLCFFGSSSSVSAEVMSSTELRCVAPASAPAKTILGISLDADHPPVITVPFAYQKYPSILSADPAFVPRQGHATTNIAIRGGQLKETHDSLCVFSLNVFVTPNRKGAGYVKCTAPSLAVGNHTLSLAIAGQELAQRAPEVSVLIHAATNITHLSQASSSQALSPSSGWMIAAGTSTVSVHGTGFDPIVPLASNRPLEPPATMNNVPLFCAVGNQMQEHASSALRTSATSFSCTMSGLEAGFSAVELTTDNALVTSSLASIEVVTQGHIDSIQPAIAHAAGGTVITVAGSGFVSGRTICSFGGQQVTAEVASSLEALCTLPAHKHGSVVVQMSTNGGLVFDSSKALLVTYASRMTVENFAPLSGWHNGAARITAKVSHAREGKPILVRFGTVQIVTSLMKDGVATFDAPALQRGNVSMSASLTFNSDVGTFTDYQGAAFTVIAAVNTSNISPTIAMSGYTTPVNSTVVSATQSQLELPWNVTLGYHCLMSTPLRATSMYVISAASMLDQHRHHPHTPRPPGSTAQCVLPARGAGFHTLEIGHIQQYTTSGNQVEYVGVHDKVLSVYPSSGHLSGGSLVTITGSFTEKSAQSCQFGSNTIIPAEYVSSSEIRCLVKGPVTQGTVQLAVGIEYDGVFYESGHHTFSFVSGQQRGYKSLAGAKLMQLETSVGSTIGGDRTVITLANAPEDSTVMCQFGQTSVTSSLIDGGKVVCNAPASVHGNSTFSISFNGQDLDLESMTVFEFIQPTNVTSVSPQLAVGHGSARLMVSVSTALLSAPQMKFDIKCGVGHSMTTATEGSGLSFGCPVVGQHEGFRAIEVAHAHIDAMTMSGMQVEFVAETSVQTLTPSVGSIGGGTVVTVHGRNFLAQHTACQFGMATVKATVVSSVEATCIAPGLPVGEIEFEMLNTYNADMDVTGNVLSRSGKLFVGQIDPLLIKMSPVLGPRTGTTVQFDINTNTLSSSVMCVFGSVLVRPYPLTGESSHPGSKLSCGAPAGPIGNSTVEIVTNLNGHLPQQTTGMTLFTYEPMINVSTMTSHHISSEGRTLQSLQGLNFRPLDMNCMLLSTSAVQRVQVRAHGQSHPMSVGGLAQAVVASPTQLACILPSAAAGFHTMEVTANGQDLSHSGIQVESRLASITTVQPSVAVFSSGQVVTITGTDFVKQQTTCRFGTRVTVADVMSTTEMTCKAPLANAGTVSFEISTTDSATYGGEHGRYTSTKRNFVFAPQQASFQTRALRGPTHGSTVEVYSDQVTEQTMLSCQFGTITTRATASNTEVRCASPMHAAGPVQFSVQLEEVPLLTAQFDYYQLSNISFDQTLTRVSTSVLGGYKWHFPAPHHPVSDLDTTGLCRFGAIKAPAAFEPDSLACFVPAAMSAGFISVEFAYHDGIFTSHGHQLEVFEQGHIDNVFPTSAPKGSQHAVTVSGSNLRVGSKQVYCHFGNFAPAAAEILSSTQLTCVPPVAFGSVWLSVKVGPSENDVLDGSLRFTFIGPLPPLIEVVSPTIGNAPGGAIVTVHGKRLAGFNGEAFCRFGPSIHVQATSSSDSRVRCIVPRLSPEQANTTVEVSTNTVDYTDSAFRYYVGPELNVTSIRPSKGPIGGGSVVTVSGIGFSLPSRQNTMLSCKFGDAIVSGTYIDSSTIQCLSPARQSGLRAVEVANAGQWSVSRTQFEHMAPVKVATASPSMGSSFGGSVITIAGNNFVVRDGFKGANTMCRFSDRRTPATVLSSTVVVCASPALRAGHYDVTVSVNYESQALSNLDFSQQAAIFRVDAPPHVTSVHPSFGPKTGGTKISISGTGFENSPTLQCLFGSVTTKAIFSNETYILCETPTSPAGLYPVTVSTNGQDFYSGDQQLYGFVTDANVTSLYPRSGLIYGGTSVFVTGWGFVNSTDLKCKIDRFARADYVNATFLSSSLVVCVVNAHEAGTVTIEVASNGRDFSHNYQLFEYKHCPKGHYCPQDAEIIPSPNGTFCPLEDLRNFTLCFPGTFQPSSGQSECVPCPVGFICPDYGMYQPRICPAGQVCEEIGLMVGSELKPCPPGHWCPAGTSSSDTTGYEDADRPLPCPEGTYCTFGTVTNITDTLNFTTPQQCFSGFYCPLGSQTPQGAGMCPPGYYCPMAIAIACPAGSYCEGFGNSQPTLCQPGTYNPLQAQAACKLSEPGTISPGLGRVQPMACPPGFVCNTSGGALPAARCPRGFFCLLGTKTSNASAPVSMDIAQSKALHRTDKPLPCPAATYCLDGVKHYIVEKGDLVKPQPCTPGAFCVEATKDATGKTCGRYDFGRPEDFVKMSWTTISPRPDGTSEIVVIIDDECGGPCPPGHYCPESSAVPIPAPKGTFSKGFGNVQSTLCFAGKFAPQSASSECLPCPAGYQCPKDGVWQQEICPPGKYRSMDDTITCQMCKPGTWSAKYAVTDASFCEACPAGRVCSLEGMTSLSESQPCPQGYVCDTYTFQATTKCQPGYWCDYGTQPKNQFDNLCPKGQFCSEGTAKNQRYRNACPANYYCPAGTGSHQPEETKCPKGTISQQNSFVLENCTRKCDDPDTNPTLYNEVKNAEGCLVYISGLSSLNRNSTAKSESEVHNEYKSNGFDFTRFTVDLRHLNSEMRYEDHWRIAVYVNKSIEPIKHTEWFMASNTSKYAVNDFSMYARMASTSFKVQLELLHGLYESSVAGDPALRIGGSSRRLLSSAPDPRYWQFNETMMTEIFRPSRAAYGASESKSFLVLLEKSDDVSLPMNLPLSSSQAVYDNCLEVRKDPMLCDLTRNKDHYYFAFGGFNDSHPIIRDEPDPRVATPELFWTQSMEGAEMAVLPYVPFFSQCRGYGSNIPIFEIFESRNGCELVDPVETVFVYQWDPFVPAAVADACNITIECAFEEKVDAEDSRARWWEIDIGETLLTFTSEPYTFDDMQGGEDTFSAFIGTTQAVPLGVEVQSASGELPRTVEVSISYFQYSATNKMLIESSISFNDGESLVEGAVFADGGLTYEVNILTEAMGFGALINAFAFGVDFFMILFLMIAIMSILIVSLFWTMQRLCTRLAHPPKFRFWAYVRVLAPSPFKGLLLSIIVIGCAVIMIWLLFRPYGLNFLDAYQITYDGKDDLTDAATIQTNRSGRTGLSFVIVGFMLMWEGTKAFIPLTDFEEEESLEEEDEVFDELSSSEEEEEDDELPSDDELLPDEMRRSHLMFAAIMEMGFLLLVVEFSYSSIFGDYIWTCLICLKIIQMFFEQLLCSYIKDVLLLCPLMVGLEMTEFVVTMGADGFIDFLMSYCVELILVLAERVYLDPALKAVGGVFPYIAVFCKRLYIDLRQKIVDPEGFDDIEEVPDPEEPEENVIEDLIDSFQVYANETTAVCLSPFLILWMLVFSKELDLVNTYGIRDSDLVYYVLFAVVIVPTQMAMDVFIQNAQELFHGWKIYEYLRYAQQRFLNRTERWKLCEKEQDESIDKNLRALDQLCFSTQFYFINGMHAIGLVFVVFAIEMMILSSYNMFADPMLVAILLYLLIGGRMIKLLLLQSADLLGLWKVFKPDEEDQERSSLAASLRSSSAGSRSSKAGSKSSRAGSSAAGVTARMKNADLMHAFLEHNRPWMLATISNLLTSEMLARNPPWLVKQLAKVFGVHGGRGVGDSDDEDGTGLTTKTHVAADISSDDGSDDDREEADYGNMDHLLTSAVNKVAMRWLSYVRVEEKLKYDISSDSSSEPDTNYEPAILSDSTRDIAELWLRKVALLLRLERQATHTDFLADISSDSSSGEDELFGHMEHVNEVTVKIAMKWLLKIRKAPPPMVNGLRADISSDDSDDEDEPAIEYNFEPAVMSSQTTKIAFRWLRHIRDSIKRAAGIPTKVLVEISSDSGDDEDGEFGGPDVSDDSEGSVYGGQAPELHDPRTKAVAYRWLGRVRKKATTSAWEDEKHIIEDVAPKKRFEKKQPKRK